ncbi:hypothetical protein EJB05_05572, partial [Eragrostis curvula]
MDLGPMQNLSLDVSALGQEPDVSVGSNVHQIDELLSTMPQAGEVKTTSNPDGREVLTLETYNGRLAVLQQAWELLTEGMMISGAVTTSAGMRRSVTNLSRRMVGTFCTRLGASIPWRTTPWGPSDDGVCTMTDQSVVLSTAMFWLPVPCNRVVEFLCKIQFRLKWDLLFGSTVEVLEEMSSIGSDHGRHVWMLRDENKQMTMLQECFNHASGSLLVYSMLDNASGNKVVNGEDTSELDLLPWGFTILPDDRPSASSPIRSPPAGSLVTVAFQVPGSHLTDLNAEPVPTVNRLLATTVEQIKAVFSH